MTITTTQIGASTVQLSINNELGSANIITAIDAAMISSGWLRHDYTLPWLKVYKAFNADGITYKFFGLHIDPLRFLIGTTSWESWNAVTHVGVNEVWNANRGYTMGYTMNSCDIIIMASPRWCVIQTFIRNSPSFWSGVVEMQREFPEDTTDVNYPCWAWVNSHLIGSDYDTNKAVTTAGTFRNFSLPRTRDGAVGQAAAFNTSLITPFDRFGFGPSVSSTNLGLSFGQAKVGVLPEVYPWDNTKKIVHTLRPRIGLAETHGRIFGLKATAASGYSPMNVASIPVDTDYFYSATGTATDHWLLPTQTLNSKLFGLTQNSALASTSIQTVQTSNAMFALGNGIYTMYWGTIYETMVIGTPIVFSSISAANMPTGLVIGTTYYIVGFNSGNNYVSLSATPGGSPIVITALVSNGAVTATASVKTSTENRVTLPAFSRCSVANGTFMYVGTDSDGVYKIDNSIYSSLKIAAISDVSISSIVYDGQYVWVAGNTRIWKIDTLNSDSVTSVYIAGYAVGQIFWSGTYLWAGTRTPDSPIKVYRITPDLSSVTLVTGIPVYPTSYPQVVGSFCSDLSGNVYFTNTNIGALSYDNRLVKIAEQTAAYVSQVVNVANSDYLQSSGCMFDGIGIVVIYVNNGGVFIKYINITTMTIATNFFTSTGYTTSLTSQTVSPPYGSAVQISKIGPGLLFSINAANTAYQGTNFIVWNNDLVPSTSVISNSPLNITIFSNVATNFLNFDGNRFIGGAQGSTILSEVTNVLRPTILNSTAGMWLLPK